MSDITFLGIGAMGSRMAFNLLKAGHNVTVWNRDPKAAVDLIVMGAKQAQSPKPKAGD